MPLAVHGSGAPLRTRAFSLVTRATVDKKMGNRRGLRERRVAGIEQDAADSFNLAKGTGLCLEGRRPLRCVRSRIWKAEMPDASLRQDER